MRKISIVLLSFLLFGCATINSYSLAFPMSANYNNIEFSFEKKGIFPNSYQLKVSNNGEGQIDFFPDEDSYYIISQSGYKSPLDLKGFQSVVGFKGFIWIMPGHSYTIPFKIRQETLSDAKEIVFRCTYSHISPASRPGLVTYDYFQDIVIRVDLSGEKMLISAGEKKDASQVNGVTFDALNLKSNTDDNTLPEVRLRNSKIVVSPKED